MAAAARILPRRLRAIFLWNAREKGVAERINERLILHFIDPQIDEELNDILIIPARQLGNIVDAEAYFCYGLYGFRTEFSVR